MGGEKGREGARTDLPVAQSVLRQLDRVIDFCGDAEISKESLVSRPELRPAELVDLLQVRSVSASSQHLQSFRQSHSHQIPLHSKKFADLSPLHALSLCESYPLQ